MAGQFGDNRRLFIKTPKGNTSWGSFTASTAVVEGDLVYLSGSHAVSKHSGSLTSTPIGISRADAAIGEKVLIDFIGDGHILTQTAGAAVAAGAFVQQDGNYDDYGRQKVITGAATSVVVLRALSAAAADGDEIEVLVLPYLTTIS